MAVVHRGLAVVAWLVATALSVGISTAAVGNVRAQVSERSSLMSLAAIRSATSTTTTTVVLAASRQADIPSLAVVLDPTTSEPPPPSTTSTSRTTAPAAVTEPAPAPTITTTPPAPETTSGHDGSEPVEQVAVDGGVVKVGLANDSLQLIDALPEEGYQVRMGEWLDAVIEVQFVGSDHLWNVVAELEDGRIVISERRVDRDHRGRDDRAEPEDGHRGEDDRRRTGAWDGDDDDEPDEGRKGRPGGRGGEDDSHGRGSGNGGWEGRRGDSGNGAGDVPPGDVDPAAGSTTSAPD